MANNIDQWVWMPDSTEIWLPVRITSNSEGKFTILEDDKKNKYKYETSKLSSLAVAAVSNFNGKMPDLTKLDDFSEGAVLYALKMNYMRDNIYINIGSILVSINPFMNIATLGPQCMDNYSNPQTYLKQSPHVYRAAMSCYQTVVRDSDNASLIISGESGSGKTVVTRGVLDYLCFVTSKVHNADHGAGEGVDIKSRILGTNPVLEAFGNAKTSRNNNSSRFGKWMDTAILDGHIVGCSVIDYLLEKVRVVQIGPSERNYHIFYQILSKGNIVDKKKFLLETDVKKYALLNQSGCSFTADGVNDAKDVVETFQAMKALNWSQDDIDSILFILSGILQLGNLDFGESNNEESQIISDTMVAVETASKLFQIETEHMKEAFITRTMKTGKTMMRVPVKKEQALRSRDSFCMALYDKLFKWIIHKINKTLTGDLTDKVHPNQAMLHIGILDIFGFEVFKENQFEQFCINHANEKLQYQFNERIFELEQEEYEKEGINISHIEWTNNIGCIELIEKKGIIAVLAEEVKVPKGSDKTFKSKIDKKFAKNEYYAKTLKDQKKFTIHHAVMDVQYSTEGFIEKTKNKLMDHLVDLTKTSRLDLLKNLINQNTKKGKHKTLGEAFISDLQKLVKAINATKPTYVRCIKPNKEKKPHIWQAKKVLNQIKAGGLFSAIAVRQQGFTNRKPFEYFAKRYKYCIGMKTEGNDFKQQCQGIIKNLSAKLNLKDIQIGKTKIFYRESQLAILEDIRDEQLSKIFIFAQKVIRGAMARRQLHILEKIKCMLSEGIANKDKGKLIKGLKLFAIHEKKEVHLFKMDEVDRAQEILKEEGENQVNNMEDITISDTDTDADQDPDTVPKESLPQVSQPLPSPSPSLPPSPSPPLEPEMIPQICANISNLSDYNSENVSSVNTVDADVVIQLQSNDDDVIALVNEESLVFKKLKENVSGSWTQRFVVKRMKIKYINILLRRRISVLHEFTNSDQLKTNEQMATYNELAKYTYYHEMNVKNVEFIIKKWNHGLHRMSGHSVGQERFSLANQSNKQYPDTKSIADLHEMVTKIVQKLNNDLKRVADSLYIHQKHINQHLIKMEQVFHASNRNPLVKESIFNFVQAMKIMKDYYKRLMVPKVFVVKMMIQYLPLFKMLSKYTQQILVKCISDWLKFNVNLFSSVISEFEKVKSIESNADEGHDWVNDNFTEYNKFINNEIGALDKLLQQQIVDECLVSVIIKERPCMNMKAILCESGLIYFYQLDDNENVQFVVDLSKVQSVVNDDTHQMFQFTTTEGKIQIAVKNNAVYCKWKNIVTQL